MTAFEPAHYLEGSGLALPQDGQKVSREKPFSPARPALQTISARDLQHKDFPPISYVVPGYIAEGLTLLVGKPKLGKSWLMLDTAIAVAHGGCAFGSIKCEPGNVLYAALEDNERRLQRRMRQLIPNDRDWPDRLELALKMNRIDAGGIDDIRQWASRVPYPRFVGIDTFACVRPPPRKNELPYQADYAAVAPLQALATELGIGIGLVHHVRKQESEDPLDLVSGTTGITGAADSILILNRDSQGVTLTGRGRDIEDFEVAVSFDPTTGRWSILGPASSVRLSAERRKIIAALEEADEPLGPKEIAAVTSLKEGNVRRLLHSMVTDGDVLKAERGRYVPVTTGTS